jgi:hypothetical protein
LRTTIMISSVRTTLFSRVLAVWLFTNTVLCIKVSF